MFRILTIAFATMAVFAMLSTASQTLAKNSPLKKSVESSATL
ncbi:hypothetical protein CLV78_109128 [Aliiruegeria haliotis]|uniref:Uncharacterized protein n=1 Tax=Aliiruegeria haliotis TaxID=1280846 RepID=A0A2T0RK00_9RHOB|nr:hypothetical protein [Aliiruegeria haliotis]PRY21515.1 hypothetical protein CLV78_109128 [Aliiruegeria haliotis]